MRRQRLHPDPQVGDDPTADLTCVGAATCGTSFESSCGQTFDEGISSIEIRMPRREVRPAR